MKELNIESLETRKFFIHAFKEDNLVPILGSGFTRGVKTAHGGMVPSGQDLKNEMINLLHKKYNMDKDELKKESFSVVAEIFQSKFSDPKEVKDYYYKNYTSVNIENQKQLNFLNEIKWSYVYTLNIDTGIEDSKKGGWEVFYPNKSFDERSINLDCTRLYKIHGDVAMFCKNMKYEEMILTENQYIASLSSNEQFHNYLASDCGTKNIIYIGCSLQDEIDIKYTVLMDKSRNVRMRDIRGIYVTTDNLTDIQKTKLEGYNISHILKLSSYDDYEYFYEYLVQCYKEGQVQTKKNIDNFRYTELERLSEDREININYLANLNPDRKKLPFYYVKTRRIQEIKLQQDKINVIIGRRFVGKTMLAHAILEEYPNKSRYYISENETLSEKDIADLVKEEKVLIVFDSGSLDDRGFNSLITNFKACRENMICVFLNSFDDVVNLITYGSKETMNCVNYVFEDSLKGKLPDEDISGINGKLNSLGISMLDSKINLLDNTLKIGNLYDKNMIEEYKIESLEELKLIIWMLVKNKIYSEEITALGLSKYFRNTIDRFLPMIQEENRKPGEIAKHSGAKVICNGKLGLLQVINNYIYPSEDSAMARKMAKEHRNKACRAIFEILLNFSKIDPNNVKEFLQFDKLNDIFSRRYSKSSIMKLSNKSDRIQNGAGSFIHNVYEDNDIKQLKADDPNYWLQRAKSIYITSRYSKKDSFKLENELKNAIQWAKKAERDSKIKAEYGEKKYYRTESNAIMQIAMLYGKLAKLQDYKDKAVNNSTIDYYYKMFSDSNNIGATKTFLKNSRGYEDFNSLIKELVGNNKMNIVREEWENEINFLIDINLGRTCS